MNILIANNTEDITSKDRACIEPIIALIPSSIDAEIVNLADIDKLESIARQTGAIAVIGSGVPMGYGVESIDERSELWAPILHETDISVLGICIMHQAIGRAYDAELLTDKEKEFGVSKIYIKEPDEIFEGLPESFEATTEHRCSITVPTGFLHLASSDGCFNNFMRHPEKNIVSTQAHIERPVDGDLSIGKNIIGNFIDSAERHAFDMAR